MIRVVSAHGFPFTHQPYCSPHGLSFVAESLFFLKVFGLSSIAMGGAMLLSAASAHWTWPTDLRTAGRVLESSDDLYLKSFAAGPGCDWYIPPDEAGNVRSCDGKKKRSLGGPGGLLSGCRIARSEGHTRRPVSLSVAGTERYAVRECGG